MQHKYIANYVFIFGLVVLILNDHLLKGMYGNSLTGKLSDFAGVLILPFFIKAIFNTKNSKSILSTIFLFAFWKSSYSQLMIDGFNNLSFFSIGRVVDYTDYFAFFILPFSYYFLSNIDKYQIGSPSKRIQQYATNTLLLLSALTFMATSKKHPPEPPFTPITNCCVTPPINSAVGIAKIYIPTLFTPDGNGLNDYFQITVDSNILSIDTFLVTDNQGDTVFYQLNIMDIIPENGFDGIVAGAVTPQQFRYRIAVTSVAQVKEAFVGRVCCIPCSEPINLPKPTSFSNCAFSIQYNDTTGYDPTISSGEVLDCFD